MPKEREMNSRLKPRRAIVPTVLSVIALSCLGIIGKTDARASDANFEDFPFLVRCELNNVQHAYYLSRIEPDGLAVYMTPDRRSATITMKGAAKPVNADWPGSCTGKTIEELQSAGQTYYLKH